MGRRKEQNSREGLVILPSQALFAVLFRWGLVFSNNFEWRSFSNSKVERRRWRKTGSGEKLKERKMMSREQKKREKEKESNGSGKKGGDRRENWAWGQFLEKKLRI